MGEPTEIARRAWRRTSIIAVSGAVIGAVRTLLTSGDSSPMETLWSVVGFGMALGGLAGTFSLLAAAFGFARLTRPLTNGVSPQERRTVARSIRSGRALPAGEDHLASAAVALADVRRASLPVSLGQVLLLYAGILGPEVAQLGADDHTSAPFSVTICIVLLVIAAAMIPVFVIQTRNARRYVRAAESAATPGPPVQQPTATTD